MEIFNLTLNQMLMMFFLIAVGFILRKKMILAENGGTMMAKLETYVFTPALFLYTMLSKCTVETFANNYTLILYGFTIVLGAICLAYPLSMLFVPKAKGDAAALYQRNVYKYSMTFGNFGFMGNFLMLGVFGDDMFYKYTMFTMLVSVFCNSWGLYVLIPKDKNAGVLANLKKGFTTPPIIGLFLGMVLGLLGARQYIPGFLLSAFDNAGKCQGPVAMVLAGFVIGGYDFKKLITNKKVYIAALMRLIVLPSLMMLILRAIGTPKEIMTLALICFATPLGLNTIVYPAAYGGDTKTGASMTMISTTLSVLTIPLMYLLFIVTL